MAKKLPLGKGGTRSQNAAREADEKARTGVAVANAAGANPTAAEFNALLTSLRNAGLIKTA